jgi:hypothetical protein
MRRNQVIIAAVTLCLLAALLLWQHQRTVLVDDCMADGGRWDGTSGRCMPDPNRIQLQRDLYRS